MPASSAKSKSARAKKPYKPSRKVQYWTHDLHDNANNLENACVGLRVQALTIESGLCWPGQLPGRKTRQDAKAAVKAMIARLPEIKAHLAGFEQSLAKLQEEISVK